MTQTAEEKRAYIATKKREERERKRALGILNTTFELNSEDRETVTKMAKDLGITKSELMHLLINLGAEALSNQNESA